MQDRLVDRALQLEARSRSSIGPALVRAYRLRTLRPVIRRLLTSVEGGLCFSESLRDIFREFYEVDLGRYSYCTGPSGALLIAPGTKIGNYSVLGANRVFRRNHPFERASQHPLFYNPTLGLLDEETVASYRENPLRVGHDVHVGEHSWILPGCSEIGDGAVVEVGSVVLHDVPPYTIVAGNPAKVVRKRFSDEVEDEIRRSEWFLHPLSELIDEFEVLANPANQQTIGRLLSSRA